MFIHTLDTIPKNWYIQLDLRQKIVSWDDLTTNFITAFNTYDEYVMVDIALQLIKEKMFEDVEESEDCLPNWALFSKQTLECYKIEEAKPEDDEPREVHILKVEGERVVEGLEISIDYYKPLKTIKVNIGIEEVLKFAFIRVYWDDEIVGKIIDLLHVYRDLFPTKFTKMKGIVGELGDENTFES